MSEEKQVRTMAKLYEARDSMRSLFGENYAAALKLYQDIIQPVAAAKGKSCLSMAVEMAREINGVPSIMCLCAGLELDEQADRKG